MSVPIDEQIAAAVLAKVDTGLQAMTTPRHAYQADAAPTTGGDYVTVLTSWRFGGNSRLGDVALSPSGWRVLVRAVGVGETNARVLLAVATEALENERVTVGGITSTKIRRETEDPIGQDEYDQGLYSGARAFTFSF